MKFNYKVILAALSVAFIATLGCDDASKKADKAQQMSLLALASGSGATGTCMNCHNTNSSLGAAFLAAKQSYGSSGHANGTFETIWDFKTTGATDSDWYAAGYEWGGSNAMYTNGGGCQICHTNEGFVKKIKGDYGTTFYNAAFFTAADADVIQNPTGPGCFTCHDPHTNLNFDRRVADGSTVTTQAGGSYAKAKGQVCANCHVARMGTSLTQPAAPVTIPASCTLTYTAAGTGTNVGKTVFNYICTKAEDIAILQVQNGAYSKSSIGRFGAHHSPTADMLLGTGGAQNSANTYGPGAHTSATGNLTNANCVQCHMNRPTLRASMSDKIGDHAFAIGGEVHGSYVANPYGCMLAGCHSVTDTNPVCATTVGSTSSANCYYPNASGVLTDTGVPGNLVAQSGQLRKGDAVIEKSNSAVQYAEKLNELLTYMANPDAATPCDGALQTFYQGSLAGTISWSTFPNGTTTDRRCGLSSFTTNLPQNAGATSADNSVKFLKAIWNYSMVREDKSFGVHNYKYAADLLWDSIVDMQPAFAGTANVSARP